MAASGHVSAAFVSLDMKLDKTTRPPLVHLYLNTAKGMEPRARASAT